MANNHYDYIIIGSGIIGLGLARSILKSTPNAKILILDKEKHEAYHASGRNSGVLHAGFYYTADSLKAKFTVQGNHAIKRYCAEKGIRVNLCGKLVVCQNEEELGTLFELEKRGTINGSNIKIIDLDQAKEIEPRVKSYKKVLYSPDTASVDPKEVCAKIREDLEGLGVHFMFEVKYLSHRQNTILTNKGEFDGSKVINCAGLYADTIAHDFGFGRQYTLIPFKGLYLKYTKNKTDISTNIYPVPNLNNPFLGVHFTKTVNGEIKIGPTAIPAFWRENYKGLDNLRLLEFFKIITYETALFITNRNHFRNLASEEMKKYNKEYMRKLSLTLVEDIDIAYFNEYTKPGIRAQLIHRKTLNFLQDFVIEADQNSIHILNAVSPAFTCSFPFCDHVVKNYL